MKKTYSVAKRYLLDQIKSKDAQEILDSYLQLPDQSHAPVAIPELFRRLLSSAQNANMKSGVVGKAIGGFNNLGNALYSFDPKKTLKKFQGQPEALLDHIVITLKPSGKIRKESTSIWPKFCKTILSAATFFNQFKSGDEFYEWANSLYCNKRSQSALPLIIAAEIEGIGYPLACDFLKELGFVDYGKPDVHVKKIFSGIGLCPQNPTPYQVQNVISQMAAAANVTAYNVDKLFWLIGSGKFYKHKNIGKNGQIPKMRDDFISMYAEIA